MAIDRQPSSKNHNAYQAIRNRKSLVDDSNNTFEHKYWALTTLFGELEGTLEVREQEILELKTELQKATDKYDRVRESISHAERIESEVGSMISETVCELYATELNLSKLENEDKDKEQLRILELKLRKRELEYDLSCIKKVSDLLDSTLLKLHNYGSRSANDMLMIKYCRATHLKE